jgi:regulator of RNase E activity RraA
VPVAGLSQQLRKRGLNNVTIDGVRPLHPGRSSSARPRPCASCPAAKTCSPSHGGGYNAQKRAFDAVGEGEVIVIEARGEAGSGTLGDILAIRARPRRGRHRHRRRRARCRRGRRRRHPRLHGRRAPRGARPQARAVGHDVTIACGGTTVQPGDIIVGDADGVIVIPPGLAEEVADAALAQEDEDAWIAARVAEGHPVDGLFPMNDLAGEVRAETRGRTHDPRATGSKSEQAYHWIKERIARTSSARGTASCSARSRPSST